MPRMPCVRDYMTPDPISAHPLESLSVAHRRMRLHGVRHLPVFDGTQLVGLLTEEDVHLTESLKEVDPALETVDAAMDTEPYVVSPEARLDDVVEHMLSHGIRTALVAQDGRIMGLFTHTDALEALLEALREAPLLAPPRH